MIKKKSYSPERVIYLFILPLAAIAIQAVYTFSSTQIRLEEVIETFRSVYWFDNRLVWNGSYSFLGWYTILSFIYNNFGMNIYTVKYIKLGIELISFVLLSLMFKRFLGVKKAWIPFLAIVLSPTFLFLNSLQLSLGTEISFLIICTYLATKLNFRSEINYTIILPLIWFSAMFAWLTYPGFIFFIPILAFLCIYIFIIQRVKLNRKLILRYAILSIIPFLLPLLVLFFYIQNREFLIYDPLLKRGIFRSYGSVEFNIPLVKNNLDFLASDFFIKPKSHYFEPEKVEFSDFYPIFGLLSVLIGSLTIAKRKTLKVLILGSLSISLIYFISLLFVGPITINGIRRATVLLVIFYFLYSLCIKYFFKQKENSLIKFIVLAGCFMIIFHNLTIFPINIKALSKESQFREKWYFNTDKPDLIHEEIIKKAKSQDIALVCEKSFRDDVICPGLSLIYPAIAGPCAWDDLQCKNILIYKPEGNSFVPLSIDFWGKGSHTDP